MCVSFVTGCLTFWLWVDVWPYPDYPEPYFTYSIALVRFFQNYEYYSDSQGV